MKYTGRNIIWFIVISTALFGGVHYAKRVFFSEEIGFSYFASDEFKARITYTLKFIEQNYPEEYKLIKSNVRIIKEPNSRALATNAPGGASYARLTEEDAVDYGLISLLPNEYHCPPSLMQDKYQLISCAGVIYHEALHHYHKNNNLYQGNPALEHYHVYKRHYEFVRKMGGDKVLTKYLQQSTNDFGRQAETAQ